MRMSRSEVKPGGSGTSKTRSLRDSESQWCSKATEGVSRSRTSFDRGIAILKGPILETYGSKLIAVAQVRARVRKASYCTYHISISRENPIMPGDAAISAPKSIGLCRDIQMHRGLLPSQTLVHRLHSKTPLTGRPGTGIGGATVDRGDRVHSKGV